MRAGLHGAGQPPDAARPRRLAGSEAGLVTVWCGVRREVVSRSWAVLNRAVLIQGLFLRSARPAPAPRSCAVYVGRVKGPWWARKRAARGKVPLVSEVDVLGVRGWPGARRAGGSSWPLACFQSGHAPSGHPGPAPRGKPRRTGPAPPGQPPRLQPRTAADRTPRRLHRTRPPDRTDRPPPSTPQPAKSFVPISPLRSRRAACSPHAATAAPPAARPAPASTPPTPITSSAPASPAARTSPTPSAPTPASSPPSPRPPSAPSTTAPPPPAATSGPAAATSSTTPRTP